MLETIATIPLIGGFLASVIPFIAVLSVIVFVHEYGHYAVGRLCGIGAEVFSIGFGPVLLAWSDRRGTRWQVAAIPFGGYVRPRARSAHSREGARPDWHGHAPDIHCLGGRGRPNRLLGVLLVGLRRGGNRGGRRGAGLQLADQGQRD